MLKNLRRIREEQKMSQEELSKRSQVNRVNISQYETCVKNPNLTTAQRLAEVLGVTVDELISAKEDMKEEPSDDSPDV
jgi:transcriptional regulator with XRE-family HTH domain